MTVSREFVDWALELLAPLGEVLARRMFGGYGLFLDGLMFAIVVDEAVWFKTDSENRERFAALGEANRRVERDAGWEAGVVPRDCRLTGPEAARLRLRVDCVKLYSCGERADEELFPLMRCIIANP